MRIRAARLTGHSEPLRVEDVDLPDAGPGEAVVEMAFAGFNPVDTYVAAGRVAPEGPLPRTLGGEGAGMVGGRPFMVRGHGLGARRDGVWATAAVVPQAALVPIPDGVEMKQAAAIGVAGVTAWRCATEKARVTSRDRVLVLGASGGVGSMLLSLTGSLGATVWAQTGDGGKSDWLRERGAAEVVVGDAGSVAARAKEFRPTVVFDPLGDGYFGAAIEVLSDKGRLVAFGTSAGPTGEVPLQMLYRKGLTIHGYGGLNEKDEDLARAAEEVLAAVADGRMGVEVDRVVPLSEVNGAFELLADRQVRGKIVIDVRS